MSGHEWELIPGHGSWRWWHCRLCMAVSERPADAGPPRRDIPVLGRGGRETCEDAQARAVLSS